MIFLPSSVFIKLVAIPILTNVYTKSFLKMIFHLFLPSSSFCFGINAIRNVCQMIVAMQWVGSLVALCQRNGKIKGSCCQKSTNSLINLIWPSYSPAWWLKLNANSKLVSNEVTSVVVKRIIPDGSHQVGKCSWETKLSWW